MVCDAVEAEEADRPEHARLVAQPGGEEGELPFHLRHHVVVGDLEALRRTSGAPPSTASPPLLRSTASADGGTASALVSERRVPTRMGWRAVLWSAALSASIASLVRKE